MKNKLLIGIFLLTISLQSCSTESEETNSAANELEQELALENNGVLKIESTTYVFKETGETAKFENTERDFNFKFINELSYSATATSRHAIEGLTVTNPETDEYMVFSDFEELKNGVFRFNIELSTGQTISSVLHKPGKANASPNRWHEHNLVDEPTSVIGAMIEFSQQALVRQCRAAFEVCANTTGVSVVALTNGKGWFSEIESCYLECHD